jgi:hypothetical protein
MTVYAYGNNESTKPPNMKNMQNFNYKFSKSERPRPKTAGISVTSSKTSNHGLSNLIGNKSSYSENEIEELHVDVPDITSVAEVTNHIFSDNFQSKKLTVNNNIIKQEKNKKHKNLNKQKNKNILEEIERKDKEEQLQSHLDIIGQNEKCELSNEQREIVSNQQKVLDSIQKQNSDVSDKTESLTDSQETEPSQDEAPHKRRRPPSDEKIAQKQKQKRKLSIKRKVDKDAKDYFYYTDNDAPFCTNCQVGGHSNTQCFFKDYSCRHCGKKGHRAVRCPDLNLPRNAPAPPSQSHQHQHKNVPNSNSNQSPSPPVVPPPNLKPKAFEYYTPAGPWGLWHFLFGRVNIHHDQLPAFIIDKINRQMHKELTITNIKQTQYLIMSDPQVVLYTTGFTQHQYRKLTRSIDRYIYAFHHTIAKQLERSARATQLVIIKNREIKTNLKNDKDFFFTWERAFKSWKSIFFVSTTIYVTYKLGQFGQYIKDSHPKGTMMKKHQPGGPDEYISDPLPKAILWWCPKQSAYIEEWLKLLFPPLVIPIGLLDALVWRSWGQFTWHIKSMMLSPHERFNSHIAQNSGVVQLYEEFTAGLDFAIDGSLPITKCKYLPGARLPRVPSSKTYLGVTNRNPECMIDHNTYVGFFPIMWPVGPFCKPCPSWENFEAAVKLRVFYNPNTDMTIPLYQKIVTDIGDFFYELQDNWQEWFAHLKPVQVKKVQACLEFLKTANYADLHDTCFPKSDEHLFVNVEENKFYPRIIVNVNPIMFQATGPFIDQLSQWFATDSVWGRDSLPWKVLNGTTITVYYTCGSTSNDCDIFIRRAYNAGEGIFILVMGDDTLAVVHDQNGIRFFECDFSGFDASQGKRVLSLVPKLLRNLKCDYEAVLYEEMYDNPIKYFHRKTKQKIIPPFDKTMRKTGESGTCFANSFVNALVTSRVLAFDDLNIYTQAGFTAKAQYSTSSQLTFLKHVLLENTDGQLQLVRLPSFLCKFGKMNTDPLTIYPNKFTDLQKYAMALVSQWKGYGNLQTNWFYKAVEVIIYKLASKYVEIKDVAPAKQDEWHLVSNSTGYISDEEFDNFVWVRYQLTRVDLEGFLSKLTEVTSFPVVVPNDIMYVLGRRDYG